ncbi:hypothetical protein OS189_00295 [Sulfitobacter sp. F26169L]|nr:hypothetical protein [Sulfitobacter sp. F26169L]MCX7564779.1 hypothetical protein [Sulfitobacter sp. F26169L]
MLPQHREKDTAAAQLLDATLGKGRRLQTALWVGGYTLIVLAFIYV